MASCTTCDEKLGKWELIMGIQQCPGCKKDIEREKQIEIRRKFLKKHEQKALTNSVSEVLPEEQVEHIETPATSMLLFGIAWFSLIAGAFFAVNLIPESGNEWPVLAYSAAVTAFTIAVTQFAIFIAAGQGLKYLNEIRHNTSK